MSYKPPQKVRDNAKLGLKLRREHGRGGLTTQQAGKMGIGSGVQRASDLASGDALSLDTVKRMKNFFSRHSAYKHKHQKEPYGAARISWLLWGGDEGRSWAERIVREAEEKTEKAMPTNVVKTPADEKAWDEAKKIADREGQAGNYAYVMGVYQRMTKKSLSIEDDILSLEAAVSPDFRKSRIYYGPRGGKYIDPQHKIAYREDVEVPSKSDFTEKTGKEHVSEKRAHGRHAETHSKGDKKKYHEAAKKAHDKYLDYLKSKGKYDELLEERDFSDKELLGFADQFYVNGARNLLDRNVMADVKSDTSSTGRALVRLGHPSPKKLKQVAEVYRKTGKFDRPDRYARDDEKFPLDEIIESRMDEIVEHDKKEKARFKERMDKRKAEFDEAFAELKKIAEDYKKPAASKTGPVEDLASDFKWANPDKRVAWHEGNLPWTPDKLSLVESQALEYSDKMKENLEFFSENAKRETGDAKKYLQAQADMYQVAVDYGNAMSDLRTARGDDEAEKEKKTEKAIAIRAKLKAAYEKRVPLLKLYKEEMKNGKKYEKSMTDEIDTLEQLALTALSPRGPEKFLAKGEEEDEDAKKEAKEEAEFEAMISGEGMDEGDEDEDMEMSMTDLDEPMKEIDAVEKAIFYGPKGGKWADAKHTIPYKEDDKSGGKTEAKRKDAAQAYGRSPTSFKRATTPYSHGDVHFDVEGNIFSDKERKKPLSVEQLGDKFGVDFSGQSIPSGKELADKIGKMSPNTVGQFENGKRFFRYAGPGDWVIEDLPAATRAMIGRQIGLINPPSAKKEKSMNKSIDAIDELEEMVKGMDAKKGGYGKEGQSYMEKLKMAYGKKGYGSKQMMMKEEVAAKVIEILQKEGGAADLDKLAPAFPEGADAAEMLADMEGVVGQLDSGDYYLISESEEASKGMHKKGMKKSASNHIEHNIMIGKRSRDPLADVLAWGYAQGFDLHKNKIEV